MKKYICVATLIYCVEAHDADEARDVIREATHNPADIEGIEYLTGDYLVELREYLNA